MRFRPCIDLHEGKVKQIVGGTLSERKPQKMQVNFEADKPAQWYAGLYRQDGLTGGHVIQLGPGNRFPALAALAAWPGGLQIGGGIHAENAVEWLDAGAAAVIVTSWVFYKGCVDEERLRQLVKAVGKERLVLDLSCRRRHGRYWVVTDRWQTFTKEEVSPELLTRLAGHCAEFLVHGVDVEGRCQGIEGRLVELLGDHCPIPVTYAGGIGSIADVEAIRILGRGRVDFTVGSALDIFGGTTLTYRTLANRFGPAGLSFTQEP